MISPALLTFVRWYVLSVAGLLVASAAWFAQPLLLIAAALVLLSLRRCLTLVRAHNRRWAAAFPDAEARDA